MSENPRLVVRFDPELRQRLTDLSKATGRTQSALVREAIALLSVVLAGGTEADKRRQFSSEFTFLAMERWVQLNLPEQHELLLNEADRRTEALYA